ncbi:unnamed protein product [Amoebophrya sp. A25]|nr:unnamed protein product [Amoebophrya sp. A25]|eukprot:GSA25T00008305001.1
MTSTTPKAAFPYGFPYPPYPLQISLMDAICDAASGSRPSDQCNTEGAATLGLFESPTGTGKTMSAVCALIKILQDDKRKCVLSRRIAAAKGETESENEPSWVRAHALKMESDEWERRKDLFRRAHIERQARREQRMLEQQYNLHDVRSGGGFLYQETAGGSSSSFSAPSSKKRRRGGANRDEEEVVDWGQFSLDLDSRSSSCLGTGGPGGGLHPGILAKLAGSSSSTSRSSSATRPGPLLNHDVDDDDTSTLLSGVNAGENNAKLQVIVCSRTHSQLSQFCQEIASQRLHHGEKASAAIDEESDPPIRVVSLASRLHGCTNPKIPKSSATACNEACQTLRDRKGCPYKAKASLVSDEVLSDILSVEDVLPKAKELEACAYYGMRQALPEADFVLVPYSCILRLRCLRRCAQLLHLIWSLSEVPGVPGSVHFEISAFVCRRNAQRRNEFGSGHREIGG